MKVQQKTFYTVTEADLVEFTTKHFSKHYQLWCLDAREITFYKVDGCMSELEIEEVDLWKSNHKKDHFPPDPTVHALLQYFCKNNLIPQGEYIFTPES